MHLSLHLVTEQNRDSSTASLYDLAVPEDEVANKASDHFCKNGIHLHKTLLDTAVCVHARMNEWNIIARSCSD